MIKIDIKNQTLELQGKTYFISSAENGVGEVEGSFCTPTGKFKIAEKIGNGLEIGSVLVGRVPTGEIYTPELGKKHPNRDWILTRILWLDGIEVHNQNTKSRYIYIHGTPDEVKLSEPGSKGCIRMNNADMMLLFGAVNVGEEIKIR
ncbi:Glutamate synthase [NADPH] large chain [uncultured Candidatus Thioglobus sp.]|nr:Glutamate synthase [NADPH] large chain [uncultured Candidatus Thioglobus sp.]